MVTAQAAGQKKAKMPADKMPQFPWSKTDRDQTTFGSFGNNTPEEVLGYLDSL